MLEGLNEAMRAVPAWSWALQGVGVATGYAGAELNARMRVGGFVLWLVSNVTLGVLHAMSGQWLLLVLDALFFRVNLLGIRHWSRGRPHAVGPRLRALLRLHNTGTDQPGGGSNRPPSMHLQKE